MRKVLYLLVVVSIVSLGIGYYMFNLPPKNLSSVKPEASLSSDELMSSFEDDEDSANQAYLGKVIEVTGMISDVAINEDGTAQLMLESQSLIGGVSCNFTIEDIAGFESIVRNGHKVVVKGKCSGYLMDVILDRCVIVKLVE